ncbi:MAG TPA: SRPBCC family protein [Acidimicrobiales bacterium]|nr:SRPBCC family protein [Acidimicrobiales bacterium]
MAVNRAVVPAPVETVFAVLSDPRTYDEFVVGTKRIRRFEPTWPDKGSEFHHTLGIGPLVLRDLTRVEEVDEPARLVLRAHMRPVAVNQVTFRLEPAEGGTEVVVEEVAVEGPAAALWNPVFDAVMALRNQEMLRRLGRVAERRLAQQERQPGPAS